MRRIPGALVVAAAAFVASPADAGTRPRYGGELRVLLPAPPQSWDPALAVSAADLAVAALTHLSLLTLAADGSLGPGLLAAVPEPEVGGRLFRLRLRPGMRFQDGSPIGARDVAASLARLLDPALGSPFSAVALPLVGAGDGGRVAGLAVTGELEVQATLAFAYPDWPRALAHAAVAITSGGRAPGSGGVGAGPFAAGPGPGSRLAAFADCPAGRPFADAVRLGEGDPRAVARALALGEADLGAGTGNGVEGPALLTTYLALNPKRLGERGDSLRSAVEAAVDVVETTRLFVRAPAVPMVGLLPPSLVAGLVPRPRPARPSLARGPPVRLVLDESAADQRAVAERLQVKLHDFGVEVQVRRLARAPLRQALAAGDWDLALVAFAAVSEPGVALAQLVAFAEGREAAREELRVIGAGSDAVARRAAASARAALMRLRFPLVPLYAQAPKLQVRDGVVFGGFDGSGAPMLADAWLLEPAKGR